MASESISRKQLLEGAGVSFMAVGSNIDEDVIKNSFRGQVNKVEELALELARAKADVISQRFPYCYVLGADQILECDGELYDKPKSLDEARHQLLLLRGRKHRLVNGLSILKGQQIEWSHIEIAELKMRNFSDEFVDRYLASVGNNLFSSVGGYRLEDQGSQLFDTIEGDYFSILGLPLLPLLSYLRKVHLLQS